MENAYAHIHQESIASVHERDDILSVHKPLIDSHLFMKWKILRFGRSVLRRCKALEIHDLEACTLYVAIAYAC